MLVIGRHVIGDPVKQGFIAASNMEGNAFMLVIDFHRLVIKLNPHLASHVLVRDSVIMLVIRKLYSVVYSYFRTSQIEIKAEQRACEIGQFIINW